MKVKKILVTGGTIFVSKYVATYFKEHGYDVYVLNRNTKPQVEGVKLIEADRHALGNVLKGIHFDVVADITAYQENDICELVEALDGFEQYIMISSSAVYPETNTQPFVEEATLDENKFWGKYGTNKIAAEKKLLALVPDAYILRPPYLYGAMNNVYREVFVFECAKKDRPFYLPKDGSMKLQFFHVRDLCRFMRLIVEERPENHIFNVGNEKPVTIREWVALCYACAGKQPVFRETYENVEQRNYFSFYDYEYKLNVEKQKQIFPQTITLEDGLKEAFAWYLGNEDQVVKKQYLQYIDNNF